MCCPRVDLFEVKRDPQIQCSGDEIPTLASTTSSCTFKCFKVERGLWSHNTDWKTSKPLTWSCSNSGCVIFFILWLERPLSLSFNKPHLRICLPLLQWYIIPNLTVEMHRCRLYTGGHLESRKELLGFLLCKFSALFSWNRLSHRAWGDLALPTSKPFSHLLRVLGSGYSNDYFSVLVVETWTPVFMSVQQELLPTEPSPQSLFLSLFWEPTGNVKHALRKTTKGWKVSFPIHVAAVDFMLRNPDIVKKAKGNTTSQPPPLSDHHYVNVQALCFSLEVFCTTSHGWGWLPSSSDLPAFALHEGSYRIQRWSCGDSGETASGPPAVSHSQCTGL